MKLFQSMIASYVLREYTKGRDLMSIINKIEEVDASKWKPAAPTSTGGKIPESEMMEYTLVYNEFLTRKSILEDNKSSLHSLIKGQCTPFLLSELKELKNTDSNRFLSLFNDLGQDMIKKRDNFPRNSVEAFDMLDRWKPTNMMVTDKYKPNTRIGHMYVQRAEPA